VLKLSDVRRFREPELSAYRLKRLGMRFAPRARVSVVLELLLVVSSVGLSVGLSRLAVGEVFRLVRIDRVDAPAASDDIAAR